MVIAFLFCINLVIFGTLNMLLLIIIHNRKKGVILMILNWFINIWLAVGCLLGIFVLIATIVLILSVFKDM